MDATQDAVTKTPMVSTLSFADGVITKIAGVAIREVDGVLAMTGGFLDDIADKFRNQVDLTKGISAEVGEKQVAIDVDIVLEYGRDTQQIFQKICDRVRDRIEGMTGLTVVELNVHVSDVLTREAWRKQATDNELARQKKLAAQGV
ncbi:Asp23/Gls24 family envelope stress response protein [Schleiferilactobacillus harbinensis]|uniref:Asp23/Gls24 family envelope stress response protein n=1 Tax=Schleiferilactobacillus harbinensis TaxID=304207 RepID=UPI0007B9AF4B|nr:Asp23/Gls24 family envelope stress response protein [Schleiferilactobacillus harbinensis]